MDGYNPYRINRDGIDWEIEDPEDPWSYIGYWGDHQIIYLLKLLELSRTFIPHGSPSCCGGASSATPTCRTASASFYDLLEDSKNTVDYDQELADRIEERVSAESVPMANSSSMPAATSTRSRCWRSCWYPLLASSATSSSTAASG